MSGSKGTLDLCHGTPSIVSEVCPVPTMEAGLLSLYQVPLIREHDDAFRVWSGTGPIARTCFHGLLRSASPVVEGRPGEAELLVCTKYIS